MTTEYGTSVDTTPDNESLGRMRLKNLVGRRPNRFDFYRKRDFGEMLLSLDVAPEMTADPFGEIPSAIRTDNSAIWVSYNPRADQTYGGDVLEPTTVPAAIELVPTVAVGILGRDARESGTYPVPQPYANFGLTQRTLGPLISEAIVPLSEEGVTVVVDHSEHAKYLEIAEGAEEDGHEINHRATSNACAVFDAMPLEIQDQLEVFATYDGTAYVKARNDDGDHVSVICQPDGRIVYRFNIDNYVVYRNLGRTPTHLIEFAFKALKPWGQT